MDRSLFFLDFAWAERGSRAHGKSLLLPSLFRDRSCRDLNPTTVCDRKIWPRKYSGKWEFLAGNIDRLIRPRERRGGLIPRAIRRRASALRAPIRMAARAKQ
jgi:hypothetical protein